MAQSDYFTGLCLTSFDPNYIRLQLSYSKIKEAKRVAIRENQSREKPQPIKIKSNKITNESTFFL